MKKPKRTPKRTRPRGLLVRLDAAELAALHAYATRLGVPLSVSARLILLDAAANDDALPRPPDHNG